MMNTMTNLLRAFMGECQASMRYSMAAKACKKNMCLNNYLQLLQIKKKVRAKIFYDHLKETF